MNNLSMDGAQLRYQLGVIGKRLRKPKPHEYVLLGFDGTCLTLEARDTLCFVQATGTWTGTARTSATLVAALALCPPSGERVELSHDGHILRFGPAKVAATWQPISTTLLGAPPAGDWLRGIALRHTKARGQLLREGLFRRRRGLEQLVRKVAKSLAGTGVSVEDAYRPHGANPSCDCPLGVHHLTWWTPSSTSITSVQDGGHRRSPGSPDAYVLGSLAPRNRKSTRKPAVALPAKRCRRCINGGPALA